MIESATFTPVTGSAVTFHDTATPFERFTTEVDLRQEENSRAQEHGLYGAYPYFGKRVIRVEGDLLASSSTDYWTRRLAMLGAFTPNPGQKIHGTLMVEPTGLGQITTEVSLDGYPEFPIEALSPSAGKYMIAFKSNDPYLYGALVTETSAAIAANKVLTSSGNSPSKYLIATISGICHNPVLLHTELDKTITLNGIALGATDSLVFDFYKRTITQITGSGTIFTLRNKTSGDWFWLQKGAGNTLKLQTSGSTQVDEIQQVDTKATGGTFTLTYSGQTTANIPYNATQEQVQSALEALSNIAVGDVAVARTYSQIITVPFNTFLRQTFVVYFQGALGGTNLSQMTGSATNLFVVEGSGGNTPYVTITTTQNGQAAGAISDTCTVVYTHKPAYLI